MVQQTDSEGEADRGRTGSGGVGEDGGFSLAYQSEASRWFENDGMKEKPAARCRMAGHGFVERTTGFEPATPDLGKVVLYQLSHVRL